MKKGVLFAALFGGLFFLYRFLIHDVVLIPPHVKGEMQEMLEEVQEIKIPGMWGRAINPGVVPLQEGYLMTFRSDSTDFKSWIKRRLKLDRTTYIGFIELDREFHPKGKANYIYRTSLFEQEEINMGEDPRLIRFQGKNYIFYNDLAIEPSDQRMCKKMHVAEVVKNGENYEFQGKRVLYFPEAKSYEDRGLLNIHMEKNWSPFVYQDEIYLIYILEPLVILKLDRESGLCTRLVENENVEFWRYGMARGGTPAIQTEEGYLSFFHSSFKGYKTFWKWREGRFSKRPVYIFGAYLFEDKAPFEIKAFTDLPFTGPNLYDQAKKIVYPTSILEEERGMFLFFGKDDKTMHVARISKEKLMKSLKRRGSDSQNLSVQMQE